jgi:hypothetical protein
MQRYAANLGIQGFIPPLPDHDPGVMGLTLKCKGYLEVDMIPRVNHVPEHNPAGDGDPNPVGADILDQILKGLIIIAPMAQKRQNR